MSTPTIAAIQTRYAGYRFRSRLEARWAVFFDAMGTRWLYEPQGYDVGGTWYLPDFWLPDFNCWVEVKGRFMPGQWETLRAATLALPAAPDGLPIGPSVAIGPAVIALLGEVPGRQSNALHMVLRAVVGPAGQPVPAITCSCFRSWGLFMFGDHWHTERVKDPDAFLGVGYTENFAPDLAVEEAYVKARSARFEHGESG